MFCCQNLHQLHRNLQETCANSMAKNHVLLKFRLRLWMRLQHRTNTKTIIMACKTSIRYQSPRPHSFAASVRTKPQTFGHRPTAPQHRSGGPEDRPTLHLPLPQHWHLARPLRHHQPSCMRELRTPSRMPASIHGASMVGFSNRSEPWGWMACQLVDRRGAPRPD